MGVPAEWRHNKTGLIKKIGVASLIVGSVAALFIARRDGSREKDRARDRVSGS
jgi:hypothetical protein